MKHWLYPTGIERDYLAAIRRAQLRPLEQAIKDNIVPILPAIVGEAERQDAPAPNWFDTVQGAFETTLRQANVPEAELRRIVERVAGGVDGFNRSEFTKVLKSVYRVDVITNSPAGLQAALGVFEAQNIALIKSIPVQALGTLQGQIVDAVRTGMPLKDLQKIIRDRYGITDRRAELIARDQIGKLNGQLTQLRQEAMGITHYTWRGILDSRERPEHVAREGRVFSWDRPPDDGHPGEPIRCFPGSTQVNGFPYLQKLYRRWHAGELTEIVLESGVTLAATANHPILTPEGLKGIETLRVGDDVICRMQQRFDAIEGHGQRFNTTIEQIFSAGLLAGVMRPVAGSGPAEFHGDGTHEKIDVVDIDSSLVLKADTRACEVGRKLGLTDTDMVFCRAILAGNGTSGRSNWISSDPEGGRVRRAHLIRSLLVSHLGPLQRFGLALSAQVRAGAQEVSPDDATRNIEVLGDSFFAYAALVHGPDLIAVEFDRVMGVLQIPPDRGVYAPSPQVAAQSIRGETDGCARGDEGSAFGQQLCRVVDIRTRDFAGHIYNFQTAAGHYTVNTVQVGNCRCSAEPVLPSWEEMEKRITGQDPQPGYTPPAPPPAPRPPPPPPVPPQPQLPGIPRPPKPVQPLESAQPSRPIEPIEPRGPVAPPVDAPVSPVKTQPRRTPTAEDREYVDYYKTGGQQKMNEVLRNPGAYSVGELKAALALRDRMQTVIGKSTVSRAGTLYRGVNSQQLYNLAASLVGAAIPIKTPQSASNSRGSALSWLTYAAGALMLRIQVAEGAEALDLGTVAPGSDHREIVLPSGGVYRVTRVSTIDDVRYIDATLERAPTSSASTGAEGAEFDSSVLGDTVVRLNANAYEIEDMIRAAAEQDEVRAGLR